jgi:GT2 family glycosyltransferase
MISVCVPTLKKYDLLDNLIESCENSNIKPDQYIIVDNGLKYHPKNYFDKIKIIVPENNSWGLSTCWNMFMHQYEGMKIIANDDIYFYPDTIEKIIKAYNERPEDWFSLQKENGTLLGFSCVIIRDTCFTDVGDFDENFYPAYYEDCDYLYRMNLLNKKEYHILCNWEHEHSATFKSLSSSEMEKHHTTFKKNQDYFIKKWGALSPNEIYKTPFDR